MQNIRVLTPLDGKFSIQLERRPGEPLTPRLVNSETLVAVPLGEPLFVFRARDKFAVKVLKSYLRVCTNEGCSRAHLKGIERKIEEFQRYGVQHPEKMKEPGSSLRKGGE